jgi:hypothetical protein
MAALGYSINMFTLFGLVLVIGIVVDDAIVVVENTTRLIDERAERPRRPREVDGGDHRPGDRHHAGAAGGVRADGFMGGITGQLFRSSR